MICDYSKKKRRLVAGLMSGTSVDGIDAALVEISGSPEKPLPSLLAFENTAFPAAVRREIINMFSPSYATVDRLGRMNFLLGELYAESVISVAKKAGVPLDEIDCIGSHGQTIYHAPLAQEVEGYKLRYTVQIGEGAVIAQRTGLPCFSDFRVADMAAGGLGAPLVPFTEYLLYRSENESLLLQNIGGIGNITVLPAGCRPEDVTAFDTGPGNMLIDGLVSHYTGGEKEMDRDGNMAAAGKIDDDMLQWLKKDSYYASSPPKTTGREYFGAEYVNKILCRQKEAGLSNEDCISTVTMLTAWSIADAYCRFIKAKTPADKLIIGGGGSYNPVLLRFIAKQMEAHNVKVHTQEALGYSSDAKEAVAFAILADRAAAGLYNALPGATGASVPAVMGKLSLPGTGKR